MRVKSLRIFAFIAIALCIAMAANSAQQSAPASPPPPAPDATQTPSGAPDQAPGPSSTQKKETPAIRVTTQTVPLTITVSDKKHNFITDLDQNDFRVLENGVLQDIRFFASETD